MQPHLILGVPADADLETIKRAYRELVRKHHPDVGGTQEDFVRIQQAYEDLLARDSQSDAEAEASTRGDHRKTYSYRQRPRRRPRHEGLSEAQVQDILNRLEREVGGILLDRRDERELDLLGSWGVIALGLAVIAGLMNYAGIVEDVGYRGLSFCLALAFGISVLGAMAFGGGLRTIRSTIWAVVLVVFAATALGSVFRDSEKADQRVPRQAPPRVRWSTGDSATSHPFRKPDVESRRLAS
ncbi:curved DNA-binding protein CbpA [Planctomycetes bacterium Pan216]|uniref:Curved DNA-binding protein CbpA n=1 Tax=Kolteria novifilia TaxID=2527975 RepID=A0A518B2E9_9BACT|nr:curved DNA-binding protein CbpA [Planctomycetes bacterium Pan216]